VVPPLAVEPVDTTGAGGVLIGSLAVFSQLEADLSDAVTKANQYAVLSVKGVTTSWFRPVEPSANPPISAPDCDLPDPVILVILHIRNSQRSSLCS